MKHMQVEMPDGSVWRVPAKVVADDRATYYSERDETTTFEAEVELAMSDDSELLDWARNNMNWSDVQAHAVRIERPQPEPDYQEGWVNGTMEVVEA